MLSSCVELTCIFGLLCVLHVLTGTINFFDVMYLDEEKRSI